MRILVTALLLMLMGRQVYAQTPQLSPRQQYQNQKKSPGLALTMEALCPIAGAGGFYAGDTDKAALLAVISGVAGGVGVGSVLWLVHLDGQDSSGFGAVTKGAAQSTAISLLVTSAVVYLLSRASGLVVASDATAAFNGELQQRLGVQPD